MSEDGEGKKTTRDAIVAATITLMHDHSSEDIRVKDIIAQAGIARSLFYYHFESVGDVVDSMITDFADGFADTLTNSFPQVPHEATLHVEQMHNEIMASFNYIFDRRDLYAALSADIYAGHTFRSRMRRQMIDAYEQCDFIFTDRLGRRCMLARRETEYYIESIVGRHLGVIECWANRRFAETPEEIFNMETVLDRLFYAPQVVRRQRYADYGVIYTAKWEDLA